jgi:hypothetical protein
MPAARRRRLDAGGRALVAAAAALALVGCFKPNYKDGGLVCAPSGKQCPDGYHCGADNLCELMPVTTPPHDSGPEPGTDAKNDTTSPKTDGGDGGETGGCVPLAPLCSDGPAAGEACSPSCQIGCACGQRCNVVDGKPACVPAGTVKLGELCNSNADNCAPGLICLIETCGNGLARCYQHCTKTEQCSGTACTINIEDIASNPTKYFTCDVPPRACNPVDNTGCPSASFNCYLTNANQTLCDCPGSKMGMNNDPCMLYSECAPGFICISGVDMQMSPHCHFVCDVSQGSKGCTNAEPVCTPGVTGAKFGYCSM